MRNIWEQPFLFLSLLQAFLSFTSKQDARNNSNNFKCFILLYTIWKNCFLGKYSPWIFDFHQNQKFHQSKHDFYPITCKQSLLYTLRKSENQRFSDIFSGYKKRPMAWNGLNSRPDVFCRICLGLQIYQKQGSNAGALLKTLWNYSKQLCYRTSPEYSF